MFNFIKLIYDKRELILEMVRRELRDRHAGQLLGTLWAFGHPLILMLVYTFLFAYVFPTRFGNQGNLQDYSTNVIAGLVPWLVFQDILARTTSVLIGHSSLAKQIVFPTEVLPIKTSIATSVPYLVGLAFAIGYSFWHGQLTLFAFTIPFLIICQFVAMTGMAFLLSVCGVFFRDIRDMIQVFCTINLFAQPILYNPYATSKWLKIFFTLNPFSYLTWCWQDALFYGRPLHIYAWILFPLGSFTLLMLGWSTFQYLKDLLGDAL